MTSIRFALLRGVCQIPAYVAHERGFLHDEGIEATLNIAPTAWLVPDSMMRGEVHFAVIPWTRVASCHAKGIPLRLICGSGLEEAAVVLQPDVAVEDVKLVAVPHEGGMKDLTAMALIERLGWRDAELVRMPSGDGAILAFIGEGGHAASMVEPYATMLQQRGLGRVIKRTGDVWPGAPGCSLCTTAQVIEEQPDLVQRMVNAYVRGEKYMREYPDDAAAIAAKFIGVHASHIREAVRHNHPDVEAICNQQAMDQVIELMIQRGYITEVPAGYADLSFLRKALAAQA